MPLSRANALLGEEAMARLSKTRIIVFGVGGVGSWCAEALVRTGVGNITLVDGDVVAPSNINRQIMAEPETIGCAKVMVLAGRLRKINPASRIEAIHAFYRADNADSFKLENFDYAIDAIDSVADKAHLICRALDTPSLELYSSMGAALRRDPTKVCATKFSKVAGDGLARALRNNFKKNALFPKRDWMCVWSSEAPANLPVRGSILQTTGVFGFVLASLVVNSVCAKCETSV